MIKEHRDSIVIGVTTSIIATLIIALFKPILTVVGNFLIGVIKKAPFEFIDSIYRTISLGKPDSAMFLLFAFTGMITGFSIPMLLPFNTIARLFDFKANNQNEESKIPLRKIRKKLAPMLIAINLIMIAIISLISFENNRNIEFEQEIAILKPIISQTKYDLLVARFRSMETYNDFLEIASEMKNLAQLNNDFVPEYILLRIEKKAKR